MRTGEPLRVLAVSAEADPYAKTGGLGAVMGALPAAMRRRGCDVRLMLPRYGFVDAELYGLRRAFDFKLPRPTGTTDVTIYTTDGAEVPTYFVKGWPWFGEDDRLYYGWESDVPRFIFFCQAVVAAVRIMASADGEREPWRPDVIHVNDWHTGLIPFLLALERSDPILGRIGTLMTVHNLAYQGEPVGGWLWELGIPARGHPDLIRLGKTDNMMAIGIAYADVINTVSPRYAQEVQDPYYGYGLDGLLRARSECLFGVLNGIDTERWNPATDPALAVNFDVDSLDRRIGNKRALQRELCLPERDEVMVIGLVSRLVEQKGIDLVLDAMRRLLVEADVQFVALGVGEPRYEAGIRRLADDFGWKARASLAFDTDLARKVYAGADLILVPSKYEPCGLTQMFAMRYGALPLARRTGGLADTIDNYDNRDGEVGTGFLFDWYTPDALLGTLRWALDTFKWRSHAWRRMQENAMRRDFSWDRSARDYERLYRLAARKRRGSHVAEAVGVKARQAG